MTYNMCLYVCDYTSCLTEKGGILESPDHTKTRSAHHIVTHNALSTCILKNKQLARLKRNKL